MDLFQIWNFLVNIWKPFWWQTLAISRGVFTPKNGIDFSHQWWCLTITVWYNNAWFTPSKLPIMFTFMFHLLVISKLNFDTVLCIPIPMPLHLQFFKHFLFATFCPTLSIHVLFFISGFQVLLNKFSDEKPRNKKKLLIRMYVECRHKKFYKTPRQTLTDLLLTICHMR